MEMQLQIRDWRTGFIIATLDSTYKYEANIYERLILPNADFRSRNLEGAFFMKTSANHSDFTNADLYWAHIDSCNFSFASFRNSDLRAAIINDTVFYHSDFRGCNLSLDNLGGNTVIQGCDFTDIIYDDNTNFNGLKFDENCIFPKDFIPENKGMQKIHKKKLRTIRRNAIFTTTAQLYRRDFQNSILTNSNMDNVFIEGCTMSFVDFSYSSFQNAIIKKNKMDHSLFYETDFRHCRLYACELSSAYMGNILYDDYTLFDGIIINERTILPKNIKVKNYIVNKIDQEFEGHWKYVVTPNYFSLSNP